MSLRTIAIDWSGAVSGSAERIWLAEVENDTVTRLECGRNRDGIVAFLVAEAQRSPEVVVGFDFAFSFPAWYLRERAIANAPALWDVAATEGESWLRDCAPPFWGRPGTKRPTLQEHLRRTDRVIPATGGIRPKSVFQIGGAGAVGTGSIRGMPVLKRLRTAGFSVWPFDPPKLPMVVEIYPRALTGPVVKSDAVARTEYLQRRYARIDPDIREKAAQSEDAFDALVSALVMAEHSSDFVSISAPDDPDVQFEGTIWLPEAHMSEPEGRGRFNSSKTRVGPVFDALRSATQKDTQWLKRLLDHVVGRSANTSPWRNEDLHLLEHHYEPNERGLLPPVSLLSWLVRKLGGSAERKGVSDATNAERRRLAAKEPEAIVGGLQRLRTEGTGPGWHVLEGPTYPDVYLVTKDALIVVEGKRTEDGATSSTNWMDARDQMLRHIDAAWEIRGKRSVYGFYVVEGERDGGVPPKWVHAAVRTIASDTIRTSLPHRSREEQEEIAACFLGATTWQAIVAEFGLDPALLIEPPNA